jgi:uncharacterized protein (DUF58 family)
MFPDQVAQQLRRIQIRARRMVQNVLGGEYLSAFKGTGLSFEEVREYQPGDDVRSIEWNVTARMGQPYIKRFVEERELIVQLVMDVSGSLNLGSNAWHKRVVATEVAALLALCAVTSGDRIGLISFSDRIEKHLRPARGVRHVMQILNEILYGRTRGTGTNLKIALEHLAKTQKRPAIVFLLSDFVDRGFEELFRRVAHQHDLTAVRITDSRDRGWPKVGLIEVQNAETGERQILDTSSSLFQSQTQAHFAEETARLNKLARSGDVPWIELDTSGRHFDQLVQAFRARGHRRTRRQARVSS